MSNNYKSFYLTDLIDMINKILEEALDCPVSMTETDDPNVISRINSDAFWHNNGVLWMANAIKRELRKDEEDDNG